MKIDINTKCCDKQMVKIESINFNGHGDVIMYVCSECGTYTQINQDFQFDEEELEDLMENNGFGKNDGS